MSNLESKRTVIYVTHEAITWRGLDSKGSSLPHVASAEAVSWGHLQGDSLTCLASRCWLAAGNSSGAEGCGSLFLPTMFSSSPLHGLPSAWVPKVGHPRPKKWRLPVSQSRHAKMATASHPLNSVGQTVLETRSIRRS